MMNTPVENNETKKTKTLNAILIGVLIGIVAYSVFNSTWGFFTLIPLYIIYKLVNKKDGIGS